jgi:hypothetical protein
VADQEKAIESKIQLLDDGMLDARPRTEEAKKITEHNAMTSSLLNLPAEIRNRIFAFAMGRYQVFISSDIDQSSEYPDSDDELDESDEDVDMEEELVPTSEYLEVEMERMAQLLWGICPPDFLSLTDPEEHRTLWTRVTYSHSLIGPKVPQAFSPLQLTCRQIYAETALLPFSRTNRFWYYDDNALKTLVKVLIPAQLYAIMHLFFHVSDDAANPYSDTGDFDLKRLTNLGKLNGLKRIAVTVLPRLEGQFERVEASLGGKIREEATKGVEVVFKMRGRLED